MKKYEQYIDSGFDWVGLVPKSWRQTQLKYISSISKGKKAKEDFQDFQEGMIPYLSMEYLRSQTDSPSYVYADDPIILLVDEQDLLILWDGSKAGEIVKAKKGALSSTMGKIHVESELFDLNYLTYYLKNAERYIQANTVGMGIPHVSGEVLRTLFITFPNKDIQTKIAQYLDYHTAIIDQLIQQKERLIELLKEKRQAVINEAVTKGLNPNAKMKDSGIEWLGDVPDVWEVKKLKYCIASPMMYGANEAAEFDNPHWPRYIRITDFGDNGELRKETFKSLPPEVANEYLLSEGDVLFARSGATVGKTFIFNNYSGLACFAGYLIKVSVNRNKLLPEFLYYFTKSGIYENWKNSIFIQSTIQNISAEKYKNLDIPLPSISEQKEIISILQKQLISFDQLCSQIDLQIDKLKEYRQAIISEAVTGKIDVRDWQPNKIQVA